MCEEKIMISEKMIINIASVLIVLLVLSACQQPVPKASKNRQDTTNYIVTGDVIVDKLQNLMWQNDDDKLQRTYATAKESCHNLILGGYDDWRLPSAKEVVSILDYTHDRGLYPIDAFKYRLDCNAYYCSNYIWTTNKVSSGILGIAPLQVDTFTGVTSVSLDGTTSYSKCVRNN